MHGCHVCRPTQFCLQTFVEPTILVYNISLLRLQRNLLTTARRIRWNRSLLTTVYTGSGIVEFLRLSTSKTVNIHASWPHEFLMILFSETEKNFQKKKKQKSSKLIKSVGEKQSLWKFTIYAHHQHKITNFVAVENWNRNFSGPIDFFFGFSIVISKKK